MCKAELLESYKRLVMKTKVKDQTHSAVLKLNTTLRKQNSNCQQDLKKAKEELVTKQEEVHSWKLLYEKSENSIKRREEEVNEKNAHCEHQQKAKVKTLEDECFKLKTLKNKESELVR